MNYFKKEAQLANIVVIMTFVLVYTVFLMPCLADTKTKMLSVTLVNQAGENVYVNYCKAGTPSKINCNKGLKDPIKIKADETKVFSCEKRPLESSKMYDKCLVYVKGSSFRPGKGRLGLVADGHKAYILTEVDGSDYVVFLSTELLKRKALTVFIKNSTQHYDILVSYCNKFYIGTGGPGICLNDEIKVSSSETKRLLCSKSVSASAFKKDNYCKIRIGTKPQKNNYGYTTIEYAKPVKDKATVTVTESKNEYGNPLFNLEVKNP